jgi:hypothetical protein
MEKASHIVFVNLTVPYGCVETRWHHVHERGGIKTAEFNNAWLGNMDKTIRFKLIDTIFF